MALLLSLSTVSSTINISSLQYKFGKEGEGNGEFNYPTCLSVNKSGHLMVCDSYNHRIQVFELNGKFFQ